MKRVVVGIPASYDKDQNLETTSTIEYLKYLKEKAVHTVMTTAGTSHFNLLSIEEIHTLNKAVVENFDGHKIIGIPALSIIHAKKFIEIANNYIDENTNLMLLYPERFYSEKEIINYMCTLRECTKNKIYIHGKSIRNATGGVWDYNHQTINTLFDLGILKGIKEEHSNLSKSYDFVSNLDNRIDIIVAGGSMRRFEFLKSAGANSFLSGVGNLFPHVEKEYLDSGSLSSLEKEKKMFDVFMEFGWHKSLRIALKYLGLTCFHDREPWPQVKQSEEQKIINIIEEIKNE